MKKYTLILILLLSMIALVACKDKEKAPEYEDGQTPTENIAQNEDFQNGETSASSETSEGEPEPSNSPDGNNEGASDSNEDVKEQKPVSGEKNPATAKYYKMPILSVTNNGKSRELKKNESALVYNLTDTVEWSFTPEENFVSDYVIMDNIDVVFEFNSKTNVLKDNNNDIYIKLHNELSTVLLLALDGEL